MCPRKYPVELLAGLTEVDEFWDVLGPSDDELQDRENDYLMSKEELIEREDVPEITDQLVHPIFLFDDRFEKYRQEGEERLQEFVVLADEVLEREDPFDKIKKLADARVRAEEEETTGREASLARQMRLREKVERKSKILGLAVAAAGSVVLVISLFSIIYGGDEDNTTKTVISSETEQILREMRTDLRKTQNEKEDEHIINKARLSLYPGRTVPLNTGIEPSDLMEEPEDIAAIELRKKILIGEYLLSKAKTEEWARNLMVISVGDALHNAGRKNPRIGDALLMGMGPDAKGRSEEKIRIGEYIFAKAEKEEFERNLLVITAGAYVLYEADCLPRIEEVLIMGLDKHLKNNEDRELFGLNPIEDNNRK